MRTRLARIGNSMGVRVPKTMLEEAGITGQLTLTVERGAVVMRAAGHPREGWAESIDKLGPDEVLDDYVPTKFDLERWEWK
jgi:antitoxin MazE